jgi:RNA polymerase sigma factor (sigma-70 family)
MNKDTNAIIEKNYYIVEKIAKYYSHKYFNRYSFEELKSFGANGLYDAVRLYKRNKGTQFKSFAYSKITYAILEGIRGEKINNTYYEKQKSNFLHNKTEYEKQNNVSITNHEFKNISNIKDASFNRMFLKKIYHINTEHEEIHIENKRLNAFQLDKIPVSLLKNLNKTQKTLLYLKYILSMNYKDMSIIMNLPKNKIEMIHFNMIEKFRSEIKNKKEYTSL